MKLGRVAGTAAISALSIAGMLAFAPGIAHASQAQCSVGQDCIWENTGAGGAFLQGSGSTADFHTLAKSDGGNWYDVVSSMENNRRDGLYFTLHSDYSGHGYAFCASTNKFYTNLGSYHFNDITASNTVDQSSCTG